MGVCMVEPRPKRNAGVNRVFSTPPPKLHGIRNCMEVYRSMARIGPAVSKQILAETGVDPDTRVKDLNENEISKLREYIEHHLKVEGDLRREVSLNIKRLVEIGCYRGVRHRRNLPVRGQNTKNNARTRTGPKRTQANNKK